MLMGSSPVPIAAERAVYGAGSRYPTHNQRTQHMPTERQLMAGLSGDRAEFGVTHDRIGALRSALGHTRDEQVIRESPSDLVDPNDAVMVNRL
jgi:hypothetical protein